jgi:hypothetical protein
MAKKSSVSLIFTEITRGFGRQLGRDVSREVQSQVKRRVLDNASKHRKLVDRFSLPGTFKGSLSKMYTLIDSFYSEYVTTNAMFQSSFYMQGDIDMIEQKMEFMERLITSDAEERAMERLVCTWAEYKEKANTK